MRRVGVNVLDPARVIESFMATEPQLRLTQDPGAVGGSTATGVYTDFQTTDGGHLNIAPRLGATTRNGFGSCCQKFFMNEYCIVCI